jgi:hypothetical protein
MGARAVGTMTHPATPVKNTDNAPLSIPAQRDRTRTPVENSKFAAFARRIVRAYSRRVADGDVEALADLVNLGKAVDEAIVTAIIGLSRFGYSDAEIAARLGVTKQAIQKRRAGGQS